MANINKIRISGTSYDIQDSNAPKVVELTQAQYDALVDKDPNVFYIITDASQADLSQYWTSAQTQSAITQSVSGKADSSSVYLKSETSGATEISTALADKLDATAYTPTDLSNYYTTAQTDTKISQAVSGKTNQSDFTAHTSNTTVHITAAERTAWNAKSDFSGSYNDLTNKLSAGTNISIVDNVISAEGGSSVNVVQTTGTSTADVMSQDAVTSAINGKLQSVDFAETNWAGTGTTSLRKTVNGSSYTNYAFVASINQKPILSSDYRYVNKFSLVETSAITTAITSSSTDSQVPSAKAVYDALGGGGASYSAGTGIDITNDVISVTGMVDTTTYSTYTAATDTALSNKQTTLTAGTGISIVDNVISATGGGGGGNANVVELTQAQYDALTTIDPDTIYVITDAQGGDLANYYTKTETNTLLGGKIDTSAITTSITSSSTDAQVPTAKAVYDIVGNIETLLSQI